MNPLSLLSALAFAACLSVATAASAENGLSLIVSPESGMDSISIPLDERSLDIETAPQWLAEKRRGLSGRRSAFWRVATVPQGANAWEVRIEFVRFSLSRGEVVVERDTGTLRVAEGRLVSAPSWTRARVEAN